MPQENVELALNELAANTRQLRTSTGSSLSELAKRAGLTKSMVKHIEHCRANPALSDVYRVANALGCRASDLVSAGSPSGAHTRRSRASRNSDPVRTAENATSRICRSRIAAGLSRDELAERAGIGRTTLLYIESGRTQLLLRFAVRLATALNRSITDFLDAAASGLLGSGALSSLASRCSGTERIVAWRRRSRQ